MPIEDMYNRDLSQSVFLGGIACLSFTGNFVFVVLIITNRALLKNAYNTMVLSLAFTDMLTGIIIIMIPSYVIREHYILPSPGPGATIFCYVIQNQFMAFTLGMVSLYTVTLLGIERWFAVFRPLQYRKTFHSSKVRIYLSVVWCLSFAANSTHLIETKYEKPLNDSGPPSCTFSSWASEMTREFIGIVEFVIKFVCPVLTMFVTYTYLYIFIKKSASCIVSNRSQIALRRITVMAAVTAVVMIICWLPNQVYYLCYKFNVVKLNTDWHKFTVILCMFNSCVNPCIFLLSNKVYRHKLRSMVCQFAQWTGCFWHGNEKANIPPGINVPVVICTKYVKLKDDGREPPAIDYVIKLSSSDLRMRVGDENSAGRFSHLNSQLNFHSL
ncbi:bombesin receptor subtype-3-like [Actinia tenebrosa]|uniref:Bombesin receptor subtype-3-like n=1 Tax=Actinia tenebrosa TaxID=6105 RepID=A0A6P8IY92_ACTTE|nr:bombesin receptor subtype-3-like [Actinia tenebrosa]